MFFGKQPNQRRRQSGNQTFTRTAPGPVRAGQDTPQGRAVFAFFSQAPTAVDLPPADARVFRRRYGRKFDEMGFTYVRQLLKIRRGEKLDDFIDSLKPMPGHRVRLLNFIEDERSRQQVACAPLPAAHGGDEDPSTSRAAASKALQRRVHVVAPETGLLTFCSPIESSSVKSRITAGDPAVAHADYLTIILAVYAGQGVRDPLAT